MFDGLTGDGIVTVGPYCTDQGVKLTIKQIAQLGVALITPVCIP